jgi:DNA-binding transcriptional ArsR family regulator
VALFRSLADPTRLAIVRRLPRGEARVVDLVAECGLAQSTVSAHLACLRDCGLVGSRPVGRASVHFLTLCVPRISSMALTSRVATLPSRRDDQRSCAYGSCSS